ncbi:hypothetical protein, partial [Halalkalibacter lacteus]|uniref:hypothetical protein n=1 Tax=Halalkalibacter lacteus TaxID=3090663 RepID=UPI002FCC221A
TAVMCVFMVIVWAAVSCFWPARLPPPGLSGELRYQSASNCVFIIFALGLSLFGTYLADRLALGLETAKLMGRYRLTRR